MRKHVALGKAWPFMGHKKNLWPLEGNVERDGENRSLGRLEFPQPHSIVIQLVSLPSQRAELTHVPWVVILILLTVGDTEAQRYNLLP